MGILPRHPRKRRAVIVIVMLVLLAMVIVNRVLAAEVEAADAGAHEGVHASALTTERAEFAPTRLDLALAFIRLEQVYRDDPALDQRLGPAAIREANRLFDRATGEFFRGDTSRVPAMLARATCVLLGETGAVAERRAALSQLRVAKRDGLEGLAAYWPPRLILPPDLDAAALEPITLSLHDVRDGRRLAEVGWFAEADEAHPNGAPARDETGVAEIPDHSFATLEIRARSAADDNAITTTLARFTLDAGPESLAENHAANADRIEALSDRTPSLSQHTLASLAYRNNLLLGGDWRPELTPIVLDVAQLREELAKDLRRAERGEDPFKNRVGEHVRAIHHHTGPTPARVYAPPGAANEDAPLPVIIAFHGAGVDEHLWFLGYGGGQLRHLAERHNFILIAPRAYTFMTDITRFDALLDAIGASYTIDPARIAIIGHSMGGVLCTAIAQARPDRVAAAVGIAGARWINASGPLAPIRFYVPEFDPIVPPESVRRTANRARQAGLPAELVEVPDQGHTLIVPAVLENAVEWLLEQRLCTE